MNAVLKPGLPGLRVMMMDDLDAVYAIEQRVYSHPWTYGIMRDCLKIGYNCCVYETEDGIVGYGIMSIAAGEAHILNLCVEPALQCQGLGCKILTHLIAWAQRHNVDTLFLEVRESNEPAISLYSSQGFNEIGRRNGYYPAGQGREDALLFAKTL